MSNSKGQAQKNQQQDAPARERPTAAYDVRIHQVNMSGPVLAELSATYNGVFAMRGMKLVRDDGGVNVTTPAYQTARGPVAYYSTATPEAYDQLKAAVVDAYRQELAQMRERTFGKMQEGKQEQRETPAQQEAPARAQIPTSVAVEIKSIRSDGPRLADATVTLGGAITVEGVRVVDSDKGLFVSMPQYKTSQGYSDACFPCTSEFHEQIKNSVLDGLQQTLEQMQDQTMAEAEAPEQGQDQGAGPQQGGMAQTMTM